MPKKKKAKKLAAKRSTSKKFPRYEKGREERYVEVHDARDPTITSERLVQSPDGTQGMIPESESGWHDPYADKC
jgi:hypothetical protein